MDHFEENFDKSDLHDGFLNWLNESEIIVDRVRIYQVNQQGAYCARIYNPRLYGVVSQDIISRKAYPFVIDKQSVDQKANYHYKMMSTYIDKTATVSI